MTFCTIVGIVVTCLLNPAAKPTAAQAATILAQAPGLSNRTNAYTLTTEELLRPRVVYVQAPRATVKTVEPKESEQARANRLGVPGGYTVLEWAIINSGR